MKPLFIILFLSLFIFNCAESSSPDMSDAGDAGLDAAWNWDISFDMGGTDIPSPQDTGSDAIYPIDVSQDTSWQDTNTDVPHDAVSDAIVADCQLAATPYYLNGSETMHYWYIKETSIDEGGSYFNWAPPSAHTSSENWGTVRRNDTHGSFMGPCDSDVTYNQHIYKIFVENNSYISAFVDGFYTADHDWMLYLVEETTTGLCTLSGNTEVDQKAVACVNQTNCSSTVIDDEPKNFCSSDQYYCREFYLNQGQEWLGYWGTGGKSYYLIVDKMGYEGEDEDEEYGLYLTVQKECTPAQVITYSSMTSYTGYKQDKVSGNTNTAPNHQVARRIKYRCAVDDLPFHDISGDVEPEDDVVDRVYVLNIDQPSGTYKIKTSLSNAGGFDGNAVTIITKAYEPEAGKYICQAPLLALDNTTMNGYLLKCAYNTNSVETAAVPPGKYFIFITGEDDDRKGSFDLTIKVTPQ